MGKEIFPGNVFANIEKKGNQYRTNAFWILSPHLLLHEQVPQALRGQQQSHNQASSPSGSATITQPGLKPFGVSHNHLTTPLIVGEARHRVSSTKAVDKILCMYQYICIMSMRVCIPTSTGIL
jgi:hypothetical protein